MTATDTNASTLLVAIDISKHRHEVLIGVPGKKRRRRMTILNTLDDFQRLSATLPTQKHMDAPITKPHARLTNLLDPLFQRGLVASTKFVPIRPRVEPDKLTSPPDRYPPISPDLVDQRSLASRP